MSKKNNKNYNSPTEINQKLTAIQKKEIFHGPLPHPNILEGYEKVLPGSAERIFILVEKQAVHRMNIESKVIDSNNRNARFGVIFAFIIAIMSISSGVFIILNNKNTEGLSIIITSLVALVGVFVTGRYFEKKERDSKFESLRD